MGVSLGSPARLLVVGHDSSRTGAPLLLLQLCKHFSARGHPLSIVLGRSGPLVCEFAKCGSVFVWPPEDSSRACLRRLARIVTRRKTSSTREIACKLLKEAPVAILNNTIANGHILKHLSGHGVPIVSMVHELPSMQRFYAESTALTIELSSHIIAASRKVLRSLQDGYSVRDGDISVVYFGVDPSTSDTPRPTVRSGTVVGCGTLDYRKGIDVFVRVAARCRDILGARCPAFVWIGGNRASLTGNLVREDLRKLGLSDVVSLVGEVDSPADYFQQAALFVLPSREDPFPLVMIEAAQAGLPIIAFRQGGGAEEFVDDTMGRLVGYLDEDAMAVTIADVYGDAALLQRMGAASREKGLSFSAVGTHQEVSTVLGRVCGETWTPRT